MQQEREVWLVRHGETEWSRDGRHTSRTDLPLTERGEAAAAVLAEALHSVAFDAVLTSPRERARRTAELAGFSQARLDDDLVEWDYGEYEGISTPQIRESVPNWTVWTHPSPRGETADEVGSRIDRAIARLDTGQGRALVFGHSHALRVVAARWLGQPVSHGRFFKLDTATISVLGYERETPVLLRWNSPVR
ncbi:MAG TPA: histidine phosphatase family protein [Nocardioidaceae bacterium]|nr:histidine phosphatase family protein [Nocardioidaceae bacterium]